MDRAGKMRGKTIKGSHSVDKGGKQFFSGVTVLLVSNLIVKLIGVLFKIPMLNAIGIEGMGYFNAAYHFYGLLIAISNAGLPVALSILVSRDREDGREAHVRKDYRCAVLLFGACGAVFSVFMYLFSGSIADLMKIEQAESSLRAVAPAVFLVTLSGAVRGYFQGHGLMTPTAISNVIEALGKLLLGLGFAVMAMAAGKAPPTVAAYAIFGLTLGIAASTLYLLLHKLVFDKEKNFCRSDNKPPKSTSVFSSLIKTALPITLGAAVLSLVTLLDTLLIPSSLLRLGMSSDTALDLYSTYTNLAVPLFSFPSSLIMPISLAIVPAVISATKTADKKREKHVLDSALRLCAIMSLPCAFGLSVLSAPILRLLFSKESAAVTVAAPLLSVLSASILFSGLMTVTNAILQAYGEERRPIISLAVGAVVKIFSEMLLVSNIGIIGAPISTFLCSLAVIVMNLSALSRLIDYRACILKLFAPALFCAVLSGAVALVSYYLIVRVAPSTVSVILSVIITALFYLIFSLKSGALPKDDILLFPLGDKLYGLFAKLKLIKQ